MFAVGVAVDRSRAGNRNVLLFEGVDEGRVVHQLDPFPASEDQRVFAGIAGKADRGPGADVQIDAALQADRAGAEISCRDHNSAASSRMARGYGLLKRFRAVGLVVSHRAKPGYIKISIGKRRRLDAQQDGL